MKKAILFILAAVLLLSSCTGGGSVSGGGSEANGVNGEAGGDDSGKWMGYGYPPYWEPDEQASFRTRRSARSRYSISFFWSSRKAVTIPLRPI